MAMKLLANPIQIDQRRQYNFFDDFETYTDAKQWTAALTNSAVPTISGALEDGVLVQLNTSATNDASFIYTTKPQFLWGANVVHVCEALIQFTEASTNNANIWFGFTTLNTVAQLVNSNGTPSTNFTGAGIYKQGGGTTWRTISSQTTTQTLTNSGNFTVAGQAGYQRLRVQCEVIPGPSNYLEVTYFIDQGKGMQPVKDNTTRQNVIKDNITLSSPGAMYLGIGIKNGSGNAETLNVDYMAGWKLRTNLVASA